MCRPTLHGCADLQVIYLYLSENCVITALPGYCMVSFLALPGYCMVSFLAKNIKPKMIILCKLSIRLRNIFFM